jgi:biotin carboxyl carrier protein
MLILEAMKMENSFSFTEDGTIKSISGDGRCCDKGQLLIEFSKKRSKKQEKKKQENS